MFSGARWQRSPWMSSSGTVGLWQRGISMSDQELKVSDLVFGIQQSLLSHLPAEVLCCAEVWPLRCLAQVGSQGCPGKLFTEICSFLDQRESAGCQRVAEPLQTVEHGTPEPLPGAQCLGEAQLEMKFPMLPLSFPPHWVCDSGCDAHQNHPGSTAEGHDTTSCPSCWNEN